MSAFWATTFAQIYPELAQLEDAGYLTHRDDPHGTDVDQLAVLDQRDHVRTKLGVQSWRSSSSSFRHACASGGVACR